MPLLEFTRELSSALINAYKPKTAAVVGRPRKRSSGSGIGQVQKRGPGRVFAVPDPDRDSRCDQIGHWPEYRQSKGRCRFCPALARVYCVECNVALCLNQNRNCFQDFHT